MLRRELIIARTRGQVRERLRAAARAGASHIGSEPRTLRELALEVAATRLAELGLRVSDEFDELAILDEAIDEAVASRGEPWLEEIAEGPGFREAVRSSVEALRNAGIAPDLLEQAQLSDELRANALAAVLRAYEAGLRARSRIDAAALFGLAIEVLEQGGELPDARIVLAPQLDLRGLRGDFVRALAARGGVVAAAEPVIGCEVPQHLLWKSESASANSLAYLNDVAHAPETVPRLAFFTAASITDELREVLRRALAAGVRWDEVEIVATDPVAYGCALDALATRIGIPVTYAVGLPLSRTRIGRAVTAYVQWVTEDFRSDVLRGMLESGCLAPPGEASLAPVGLARTLRRLKVGWGRARYAVALQRRLQHLDNLDALAAQQPPENVDEFERAAAERARERGELVALQSVIVPLLEVTPDVSDGVSVGALAVGVQRLLDFVPVSTELERSAANSLRQRLDRMAATLVRTVSVRAAAAILRDRLDMRVPAVTADEPPPWGSAGGHLHFSDIEHGGWSGRTHTFIVGLDAARFPGGTTQDPLLTDDDRRTLQGVTRRALPTTAERMEERRFALAALLSRVHGAVTLSYAAWDATEARINAPASVLLQAHRLSIRDAGAGYDALHAGIGQPISAVPRAHVYLDRADVWLGTLERDGVLRAGEHLVRQAFQCLNDGLIARDARVAQTLNEYSGRIVPRADVLDPRRNNAILVSARRIETLGACPLRYLHRYVLNAKRPEDPVYEPEAWLDPLARGDLLHRVYEIALHTARVRRIDVQAAEFEALVNDVLSAEAVRMLDTLPAPSDSVFAREVEHLRDDVRNFVEMTRGDQQWAELEVEFGLRTPIEMDVPGGAIRIQGRMDRVDDLGEGLLVIDYKTGSTYGYDAKTYNGGRRIQHVLYTYAAQMLLGRPVLRMDYRFPTVRGRNEAKSYFSRDLTDGRALIGELLERVEQGVFAPSDTAEDCRFCDFAETCRVRADSNGNVSGPGTRYTRAGVRNDAVSELVQLRKRYV